jgi:phospholipid/cholesterol/gamma-HCH transport system ATP-binding protein
MENEPLIEFKDVAKRFESHTILDRINLKIYQGQVTTIIGKSGTGKSVLLKHIIGLIEPDEGRIFFMGKPLGRMSKRDWNAYASQVSYLFQNNALFDSMTVYENIAMPLRENKKLNKKKRKEKATAIMAQIELDEVADKYPAEISGGMQKRTALARALVTDPKIVLLDEPTTGQDPIRKNNILGMIAEYQRKFSFTAVLISHDIPDVYYISDRILALYDKKVVFEGSPEELENFEHPFNRELAQSLEALKEELNGHDSKLNYMERHPINLEWKKEPGTNSAVLYEMKDLKKRRLKDKNKISSSRLRAMEA